MLTLRLLDPLTDQSLYQEAYSWRQPKRHLQLGRMSFEVFASDDPTHITFGLFDDQFIALYFLHELEPCVYQVHMTAKKGTRVPFLLSGAKRVAQMMMECGASHLVAILSPSNKPLCQFVEALGFVKQNTCQNDTPCSTLPNQAAAYVKYVL